MTPKMICPECRSWAEHIRTEKELKHCRRCGQEQEFIYHIIKSPTDGKERRILCHNQEMLQHLAECQPELLAQAGVRIEIK